jgi:hypothetical protein
LDLLCKEYLPPIVDRIVAFRLSDDDETPGQINYFLSYYSQLINLQSLSLSKIDLNIVDSWYFEAQQLDIIWSLPKLRHYAS